MDDLRWEIAKLPPNYSGMGWKTGSHTYGAHYIASLTKTSACVSAVSPTHEPLRIAQPAAGEWLRNIAPESVTVQMMMNTIRNPEERLQNPNLSKINLSTAQQCDEWHWKKLLPKLNDEELFHTLAHSGSTNWWATCTPLAYKKWNIPPDKWTAATRRRLHLDVIPAAQQCSYCHWQRCDTKGNHAVMCKSGPSRIWRHNSIRDLLAKAIENVGYQVGYEHSGGLPDERRPGDIIVYNWTRDKHLLIDVGVTNPLAAHNRSALLKTGPGGGAAATEKTKRNKYRDIDFSKYTYLPFILETSGAFGDPALEFKTLKKIWLMKCCAGNDSPNFKPWERPPPQHRNVDPLLVSISVLLQCHNGQMILERAPLSPKLLDSEINMSQARTKTQQKWAADKLNELNDSPPTLKRFLTPPSKEGKEPKKQGTLRFRRNPAIQHSQASLTHPMRPTQQPQRGTILNASSGNPIAPTLAHRRRTPTLSPSPNQIPLLLMTSSLLPYPLPKSRRHAPKARNSARTTIPSRIAPTY